MKAEDRMLAYLEKRIKAQERLLVVYRMGTRPSETTLDTLDKTSDGEGVLKKYREQK